MMKENKFRKFNLILVLTALICLSACGFLVYYVDPFYQFHDTMPGLKPVAYGEMYQNLGEAEHLQYNALITGTSVTESFQKNWFEEKYHVPALKAPFAGGSVTDFERLFKKAFASGNQIQYIFAGVDLFTLDALPDAEKINYDTYVISNNPLDKMMYLFNRNILLHYVYLSLYYSRNPEYSCDRNKDYVWSDDIVYGKDAVLSTYARQEQRSSRNYEESMKYVDSNISRYEAFVTAHPETEFYFYLTPYSILFWDQAIRLGGFDIEIDAMKHFCGRLLAHENVHVYNFSIDAEIITNLDNYKDYAHFKPAVNRYMFECLDTEKDCMTLDNFNERINEFRKFASSYDYDGIFE